MPKNPVHNKVKGSFYGGAAGIPVAIIATWLLKDVFHVNMPTEVASAVGSVASVLIGFLGGYFKHG